MTGHTIIFHFKAWLTKRVSPTERFLPTRSNFITIQQNSPLSIRHILCKSEAPRPRISQKELGGLALEHFLGCRTWRSFLWRFFKGLCSHFRSSFIPNKSRSGWMCLIISWAEIVKRRELLEIIAFLECNLDCAPWIGQSWWEGWREARSVFSFHHRGSKLFGGRLPREE